MFKAFKGICWVNWLFAAMILFLAVTSISFMLFGCGNKGDLRLPEQSTKRVSITYQQEN